MIVLIKRAKVSNYLKPKQNKKMTVLAVFGYGLVAFGPMVTLFCVTVATHAHEIIILMSSAFFWLLSLFFSSIIWIAVPPLKQQPAFALPFSVLLQEFFRWAVYRLLRRVDKMMEIVTNDKTPRRKHKFAYVSGMGFGMIAAVVLFANVLRESGGPGIVGVDNGGSQYFVLISAFGTNAILMLHICWGVLWFHGWDTLHHHGLFNNKNGVFGLVKVLVVVLTHMFISCLSLINTHGSPLYFLIPAYVILGVLILYSLHTAGLNVRNLKYLFYIR